MSDDLYDGPCEAGCQHFHGGEVRHVKGCGHYAESLTKEFEDRISDLERQNQSLNDAQETHLQMIADLEAEVERLRGEKAQGVGVKPLDRELAYQEYINEPTPNGNTRIDNILGCIAPCSAAVERHVATQIDMAFQAGWSAAITSAPVSVEEAARENIVDAIEEIIAETHDLDVTDRNYAENIVGWLERHHPAALRTLAGGE